MPGSDSPFQASHPWMPSCKYAMAAHCTALQCRVGNGQSCQILTLSVTSCESSSLTADTSIWYISPASSSSKPVSWTSFDLHLEAKWFLFLHFLHSFQSAARNSQFSGCWYPQLSHSLPRRPGPCCSLLRRGFPDFRELPVCYGSTLFVPGTTLFVSDTETSPTIFICAFILSAARQVSSVFAKVSLD